MGPKSPTVVTFMRNFLIEALDNYLHKNPEVAGAIEKRI